MEIPKLPEGKAPEVSKAEFKLENPLSLDLPISKPRDPNSWAARVGTKVSLPPTPEPISQKSTPPKKSLKQRFEEEFFEDPEDQDEFEEFETQSEMGYDQDEY